MLPGWLLWTASLMAAQMNPTGYPDGIAVREILRLCSTVREAIEFARATPVMTFGENLLVADAAGNVAGIGLMPHGVAIDTEGPLFYCNRPTDPLLLTQMAPDDPIEENSKWREHRLRSEMAGARSENAVEHALFLLGGVAQSGDCDLFTVAHILARTEDRALGVAGVEPGRVPKPAIPEWRRLGADRRLARRRVADERLAYP